MYFLFITYTYTYIYNCICIFMSVVALFATLSPPERVPQPQPVTAMQSAITPMKRWNKSWALWLHQNILVHGEHQSNYVETKWCIPNSWMVS